ncbi:hypothetical protein KGF54_000089 [Candida jiufengensis]|uniref:uncharacterized protein n=1 Tax=Candida jiufengensis TaxID=497108 RepID=UPI00222562A2|nr:uncharacterized protein KGF54_000089 [Candida jiufengensis]KAI5957161.1 hypothetical protein KGF54_000089 [Candida jiufengensis]
MRFLKYVLYLLYFIDLIANLKVTQKVKSLEKFKNDKRSKLLLYLDKVSRNINIDYCSDIIMNQIIEEITLNGEDYTIVISYNHKIKQKAPITIYLIQSSASNNPALKNYIYAIQDSTTQLIGLENLELKLFVLKLVKKLEVPIYFGVISDENILSSSTVELFKTIIDLIKEEEQKEQKLTKEQEDEYVGKGEVKV